jgi:hypothetical protein
MGVAAVLVVVCAAVAGCAGRAGSQPSRNLGQFASRVSVEARHANRSLMRQAECGWPALTRRAGSSCATRRS